MGESPCLISSPINPRPCGSLSRASDTQLLISPSVHGGSWVRGNGALTFSQSGQASGDVCLFVCSCWGDEEMVLECLGRRLAGVDRRAGAEQERVHGAEAEEGAPVRYLQDRRQEGGDRRREDRGAGGELRRLHGVAAGGRLPVRRLRPGFRQRRQLQEEQDFLHLLVSDSSPRLCFSRLLRF
jgi:hypothetical protein